MKYLRIILFLNSLFFIIFTQAYALCVYDNDWPTKPCSDLIENETLPYDEKKEWQKYYEMKGKEWMEAKKVEMIEADKLGLLKEWIEYGQKSNNFANANVWKYYSLYGESPAIQPYNEGKIIPNYFAPIIKYYYASPMILAIIIASASIGGIVIFRKIK
jgi:hypothetical protein